MISFPSLQRLTLVLPAFLLLTLFIACKPSSALYDAAAFSKTTELKAKTIKLMEKGTESFASHKAEADAVLKEANSIYEQQKKRENNALSVQQWKMMLEADAATNTDGILTGFFKEWEKTTTPLTKFYVSEKRKKVAEGFDEILKLEGAKPKPKK